MNHSKVEYTFPSILSAGLMLSYKCSNACKHCVYRCSPKAPNEWISSQQIHKSMRYLASLPSFHGLHLAGGEATLNIPVLIETIQRAKEYRIAIEYLETNAFLCRDLEQTCRLFAQLKEAGLPCIMISISMYHLEFVPLKNTENAIRAAEKIFGPNNYFIYPSSLWPILRGLPSRSRFTLKEFLEITQLDPHTIRQLFPLIPLGWVPETLKNFYPLHPWEAFQGSPCADRLLSPFHAHIDLYGNIFTGSCCGLSPFTIDSPYPHHLQRSEHPIFSILVHEGPTGLLPWATSYGFQPLTAGYISKCHLCYHIRRFLHGKGNFSELRPSHFYQQDYPFHILPQKLAKS